MGEETDWRLFGQERYLQGVVLVHRGYRPYPKDPNWDHDHCGFCGATFTVEPYPDTFQQGYATEDDYHWICELCFDDFREMFGWSVIEALT